MTMPPHKVFTDQHKARAERTAARNQRIQAIFWEQYQTHGKRSEVIFKQLSQDFFLAERTLQKIVYGSR